MKGIVFNQLEQAVREQHGEDMWDDLLDRAGQNGAYTSLGNYDDAELYAIVEAASQMLGLPGNDVVRWFGQSALPQLARAYPEFFDAHDSTIPFLMSLNAIVHPEVVKLYPGSVTPYFGFDRIDEGTLSMTYYSERSMCAFAEGMIESVAAHYGQAVTIVQDTCKLSGDDVCVLVCTVTDGP